MAIKKRTSHAVLVVLLAVTLFVSSHVTVEATTSASHQSSRRLPTRRVRGSRRAIGIDNEALVQKLNVPTKDKTKTSRNKPRLPKVFRPVPQEFDDLGVNPQLAARPSKGGAKLPGLQGELKLPGSQGELKLSGSKGEAKLPESEQATDVKVNKKSDNNPKAGILSSRQKGTVENGLEHFHEVEVEVYRREIPSISIQFIVEDPSSNDLPNLADYNELTDVSEEYLDKFFRTVFEDVQVRHDGTVLFVMVSEDDPYTVDFRITLEFIIPGEVPTINYLIDRLQDGLERDTSRAFFISDLSMMSETNPFSKTDTFRVVSRPPVSAAEMGRGGGNKSPVDSIENLERSNVLTYLLVGMGCVVLVGAGLMWKKKMNPSELSNPKQIFSLFEKKGKKDATTSSTTSGIYGADEETMNYLNSIRKRYRDYDGKRKVSSPASKGDNIAAVEQTGSYDASEDSMSDSVNSGFDDEKKDSEGLEDDLRTIY